LSDGLARASADAGGTALAADHVGVEVGAARQVQQGREIEIRQRSSARTSS
jgi:hypothetical protein